MMKNYCVLNAFFLVLFCCFPVVSCAGNSDIEGEITGTGEGDSVSTAKAEAFREIAEFFQVHVKSLTKVDMEILGDDVRDYFKDEVETSTSLELRGVTWTHKSVDDGFEVNAKINIARSLGMYQTELDSALLEIQSIGNPLEKDTLLQKYRAYKELIKEVEDYQYVYQISSLLNSVNGNIQRFKNKYQLKLELSPAYLAEKLNLFLQNNSPISDVALLAEIITEDFTTGYLCPALPLKSLVVNDSVWSAVAQSLDTEAVLNSAGEILILRLNSYENAQHTLELIAIDANNGNTRVETVKVSSDLITDFDYPTFDDSQTILFAEQSLKGVEGEEIPVNYKSASDLKNLFLPASKSASHWIDADPCRPVNHNMISLKALGRIYGARYLVKASVRGKRNEFRLDYSGGTKTTMTSHVSIQEFDLMQGREIWRDEASGTQFSHKDIEAFQIATKSALKSINAQREPN